MTRHLFVLNPASGRKDITQKLIQIINGLKLTDPYDIYVTDAPGSAERECANYLRAHSEDFTRIYSCGGDGTLSEVANGVYRSGVKNCAVAIVPVGSGNDFIRSFDVPIEDFRNIRKLTTANTIDIDLLVARENNGRDRVSLNIISAGFDAAAAKGQKDFKRLPFVSGSAAYKMSLVKCLFTKMKNHFTLMVDGETISNPRKHPYLFAIAANGKFYGGGFKAAPFSDLRDGKIDFILVDTVSKPKFLSVVGQFRKGEYIHQHKDFVNYMQCKKMQIISDSVIDLNLDGEIYPMRNPIIEILPKSINLIIPNI